VRFFLRQSDPAPFFLQNPLDKPRYIVFTEHDMANLSTRQAAKMLGLSQSALTQYIRLGKVPAPRSITSVGTAVHIWSEGEVEKVRKLLPKIANGRKTRWQKQRESEKKKQAKPKKKTKK